MAKVLIVEDEPLVARMYQKTLEFDGHKVSIAIGGKEGLEKTKTENPDIVLLDIMMPEPNGMDVLEKIRNDPQISTLPVVMLTNLSGRSDAELAKFKGATDYWVKKDAHPKDLGVKIKQILENKPADAQK